MFTYIYIYKQVHLLVKSINLLKRPVQGNNGGSTKRKKMDKKK